MIYNYLICCMKKIITKKAQQRLERNKLIIKEYNKLYTEGSHITAVCEQVAINLGLTYNPVYKAVNSHFKSI